MTTWIQEKEWCHASSLLLLSSQCPYDVIPVPRHWDPEKFACKQAN
ncbi:hypothetical protein NMD99_04640 [Wolbachia endosymbiont of Listronotus oregonensis]|nr:hypothetical protein [Wolbachia endosymbiont of Listronotus oregonensis]WMT83955.1 hypothetical protein NMD99_04640 [Wolbachia endosymbiont of Listronotus oregonensis]